MDPTVTGPDEPGHPWSPDTPDLAASAEQPQGQPADTPRAAPIFNDFYREAVPRLVAFLRWQGAPLSEAADCVQETMIEAFRRWSTIRHPYAWCRLVASRRYVRLVATNREDLAAEVEPAGAPLLGPEDAFAELEQRHNVLRVLDSLAARQRQVLAWTYDGATPKEIAAALQITAENVRANLYIARKELRARLDTAGGEL